MAETLFAHVFILSRQCLHIIFGLQHYSILYISLFTYLLGCFNIFASRQGDETDVGRSPPASSQIPSLSWPPSLFPLDGPARNMRIAGRFFVVKSSSQE
ncbi:MAG: hypothetical protein GWO11_07155 [Desulfuromonadales bacterium]|nr:hypothetical protein [Desulfuromonadales bacterium]NIR34113.1 hypothetical protein [Desulfuromonadales bacterium]NIS41569.1 hypothetical protein [Desulfuromonadales bacterium]